VGRKRGSNSVVEEKPLYPIVPDFWGGRGRYAKRNMVRIEKEYLAKMTVEIEEERNNHNGGDNSHADDNHDKDNSERKKNKRKKKR